MYYKEESLKCSIQTVNNCQKKCSVSSMCNTCLKRSKTTFSSRKKDPETWLQYGFNVEGVSSPSSLNDIFLIEEKHRNIKFHLFEVRTYYLTPMES